MQNLIEKKKWVCYVLKSKVSEKTYVGSTNDIQKRIRQHNKEIKGGAKATKMGGPYKIILLITGFKNRSVACQYEWLLKHPEGKKKVSPKFRRPNGKINSVNTMFFTDYFKKKDWKLPKKIYVKEKYKKLISQDIKDTFKVKYC